MKTPPDAPALAVAAAPWALELRGDVERYDGVFRLGQTSRSPALESEPASTTATKHLSQSICRSCGVMGGVLACGYRMETM